MNHRPTSAAPFEPSQVWPWVMLGQGLFYLVTGLWPLVSINTFQKVTGPKQDLWLVKTVGLLIAVIGAVFVREGIEGRVSRSPQLLSVGSAASLAAIDLNYALRGRISKIYLYLPAIIRPVKKFFTNCFHLRAKAIRFFSPA